MKNSRLFTHLCYISMLFFGVILGSNYLQAKPINTLTVTATPTAETCNGNGSATITIDDTEAGAELQIILFKKPDLTNPAPGSGIRNTTATGSQVSEVFNGLAAGDYTVKVTQSVETTPGNTETNETTTDFTVGKETISLQYRILETPTCNGTDLTVDVTQGTAVQYELLSSTGSVLYNQVTNVFKDLTKGETYTVKVTNECGEVKVLDHTVKYSIAPPSNVGRVYNESSWPSNTTWPSCSSFLYSPYAFISSFEEGNLYKKMAYPVTYKITATVGGVTTNYEVIQNSRDDRPSVELPIEPGKDCVYKVDVLDACGGDVDLTESQTVNVSLGLFGNDLNLQLAGCGGEYMRSFLPKNGAYPMTLEFIEYPAGFDPATYASKPGYYSPGSYTATFNESTDFSGNGTRFSMGDVGNPLPKGNYTVKITDACGQSHTVSDTVEGYTRRLELHVGLGLESDEASLRGNIYYETLTNVTVKEAPQAFIDKYGPLPVDISSKIIDREYLTHAGGNVFSIKSIPSGAYTFVATSSTCEEALEASVTVDDPVLTYNGSTITPKCGSFDLYASATNNLFNSYVFGQWYNPETKEWKYLGGSYGVSNHPPSIQTDETHSNGHVNINKEGRFRVILLHHLYKDGEDPIFSQAQAPETFTETYEKIETVLEEFEYYNYPTLNDYYVFECPGGKVNLALDVFGVEPFNYSITSKNGDTSFTKDNGNDPVFTNLDPGMYSVKVEDNCGNIINVTLDARSSKFPTIKPNNLCQDENGYLYLPGLDFLNITWFKDGNPVSGITGIIQDQNYLRFEPFDNTLHQGTYTARLTYPNGTSCIDETLSFTIGDTSSPPNAGTGQEVDLQLSKLGESIDLFDYLTGTYDSYGTWEEITSSNSLIGNIWMLQDVQVGTYQFKYTIEGFCNSGNDQTIVTLNITNAVCTKSPTQGTPKKSNVGISTLNRNHKDTKWVTDVNNGYLVLESKEKGFIITRTTASNINDAQEGMIIWDTTDQCIKLYNGTDWKCIEASCNE